MLFYHFAMKHPALISIPGANELAEDACGSSI